MVDFQQAARWLAKAFRVPDKLLRSPDDASAIDRAPGAAAGPTVLPKSRPEDGVAAMPRDPTTALAGLAAQAPAGAGGGGDV